MSKPTLFAMSALALGAATAHAQEAVPDVVPAGPTSNDPFQKGTLGISVPIVSSVGRVLITSDPVPTIDFVYFIDSKAALDIIAGINVHKEEVTSGTPPTTNSQTIFGFAIGGGYRMYKHMDKLHSFIEPSLIVSSADTSTSAALTFRVGGDFGLERMLTDWLSLSGKIGGGVSFANSAKDIQFVTAGALAANFYWH